MRRDEWYFLISRTNFGGQGGRQAERTPYSSCFPHLHQMEGVPLGQDGSNIATCRGTRDLIVRRRSTDRGAPAVSGSPRDNRPHSVECPPPPRSTRALCGSCRRSESERVSTCFLMGLRRQHIEDSETRPLHGAPFGLISGGLLIPQTIQRFSNRRSKYNPVC